MIRRQNPLYNSNVPYVNGDIYYAQDICRDYRHMQDYIGSMMQMLYGNSNAIIEGCVVTQGAGATLNITTGKVFVKYAVDIPSISATWTLPPTKTSADLFTVAYIDTQTNLAIPSYTAGGATNYVKVAYAEVTGNTRTRAKLTGSYAYEVYPSYTITCNTTAPTAYECEIARFTEAGGTFTFTNNRYDLRQKIGRSASIVIASSDSSTLNQLHADFVINTSKDAGLIINSYITQINASGGGELRCLAGTYNTSTNILPLSNVNISGEGVATVFKRASSSLQQVIYVANTVSNVTMRDFYVDGNGATYPYTGNCYGICGQDNTDRGVRYYNVISKNHISSGGTANAFNYCTNLLNCTGEASANSGTGRGFYYCINNKNCVGTGTGNTAGSGGRGFESCINNRDCIGGGTGNGGGSGYGFLSCNRVNFCTATGTTKGYYLCYVSNDTTYPINQAGATANDTPTYGWNLGTGS